MDVKSLVSRIANGSSHRQLRDEWTRMKPGTSPLASNDEAKISHLLRAVEGEIQQACSQVAKGAPEKAREFLREVSQQMPLVSAIVMSKSKIVKG